MSQKKSLEEGEKVVQTDGLTPLSELTINPMESNLAPHYKLALTRDKEIAYNSDEKRDDGRQRPEQFKSTLTEVICVATLALGPSLGTVNLGAIQIALPKISEDFGVVGGPLSWAVAAFTLSNGSFLLIMGGICDAFSRKWVLVSSFLSYSILCLISGFIHDYISFCIVRGLQGVFGSAAVAAAVGLMGSIYSPGIRKNRAMATLGGGAPIGFVFGIISGGICCEILSWRAVMFFQAILFCGATAAAVFFVPKDYAMDKRQIIETLKGMDYGGICLVLAGLVPFTFSMTQAEVTTQGWSTPYIIALLVIGFTFCIIFCIYEAYIPKNPILPMSIWKYRGFGICMATVSLGWMSFAGITSYYLTLYFQVIENASSILTTVYFLPYAIGGLSVNIFAAFTLHRISGRILLIIAMTGYTASALMYVFIPVHCVYWEFPFPAMLFAVVGADLSYNVGTLHTLSSVSRKLQSTAGSLFNTNMQLSTTIALSISTAIVATIVPDQNNADPEELLHGFRGAYYFAVALSGLGLFLSFFVKVGRQGNQKRTNCHDEENQNRCQNNSSEDTNQTVVINDKNPESP